MAKVKTVNMFGIGNFIIGKTLYAFRGGIEGEDVEVQDEKHISQLEAESKRRRAIHQKITTIDEQVKAGK